MNRIVHENRLPGTRPQHWDIEGVGDLSIQGFATDASVNVADVIGFKVDTDATDYTIDIFRLGYYGGCGARHVASLAPCVPLPQRQPACVRDDSVGLADCGSWQTSAVWHVPADAVSGVYVARPSRADTGGASHIPFVVRADGQPSDIVFQTADQTWQAYNRYGGASFYTGSSTDLWESESRARKVSYNRPYLTRGDSGGRDFLFSNEYPTIRFLERNGYDVSYISGIDIDRFGADVMRRSRVFLSVGHDEYWSDAQRCGVEKARDAGTHLMFLAGNSLYWRTRFEVSAADPLSGSHRTLVCYKDTWDGRLTDPAGEATATWRDPRFSPPPRGGLPENAVLGTLFMANSTDLALTVTAQQGKLRLWRGTGLERMRGASTTLAPHTVGYESDEDIDNGFRPAGLIRLSTTCGPSPMQLTDFGQLTTASTTTHHVTLYRADSGALVFSAGSIQWGWGLDEHHDGARGRADRRMQQATVNMLADMGVQPGSLSSDLRAASAPADALAPRSTITSPGVGELVANGSALTVRGTAIETDGVVAGVEVSVDGGASWHPATGTTSWRYSAVVHALGEAVIMSRAIDDSANIEAPPQRRALSVAGPSTLFGLAGPRCDDCGDDEAAELGVRFSSSAAGYVHGVRFYTSTRNEGPHRVSLWSASGERLATEALADETGSGWQTSLFARPVPIQAETTYVASYFAPVGHYATDPRFFYYRDYSAPPLRAEATLPDGSRANGVIGRRAGQMPTGPSAGSNYHVDVIFSEQASLDPFVTAASPTGVADTAAVRPAAGLSAPVDPSAIAFVLTSHGRAVAGSTAVDDAGRTVSFRPVAPLAAATEYEACLTLPPGPDKAATVACWSFSTPPLPPSRLSRMLTAGLRLAGRVARRLSRLFG